MKCRNEPANDVSIVACTKHCRAQHFTSSTSSPAPAMDHRTLTTWLGLILVVICINRIASRSAQGTLGSARLKWRPAAIPRADSSMQPVITPIPAASATAAILLAGNPAHLHQLDVEPAHPDHARCLLPRPSRSTPPIVEEFCRTKRVSFAYGFTGLMDEVAIWNRALTGADVLSLYNALTIPEPGSAVLLSLRVLVGLLVRRRRKRQGFWQS